MLLVNSDIYSIISGHRNYFMDQKIHHNVEIERLTYLYEDANNRNSQLEKQLKALKKEYDNEKERLEKEIYYFKERVRNLIFIKLFNFFS